MKLLLAITLLFGCQQINAKYISGKCPDFQTVADFDLNQYIGRWYEMNHINDYEEKGDQCVTMDFGYVSDTEATIYHSWIDEKGLSTTTSSGELTEPGRFLYRYGDGATGFYNVLAVDYDRYSSAYSCHQQDDVIYEFAWIHFRSNVRDQALIDEALEAFTNIGVDVSAFDFTYQGTGCLYTDSP